MNRKHDRVSALIADTFHPDWDSGRAADYARSAARAARRRRATRRGLAAATAVLLVASLGTVASRRPAPHPVLAASQTPPSAAIRSYEVISDDELLALLDDQPVLVVTKPDGRREITLLDGSAVASDPLE